MVKILATLALLAHNATAGPYMTGLGMTNVDLFPNGLFPDCSGPLFVGGGYATGLDAADAGGFVRFGMTLLKFDDVASLASPQWMAALDFVVHAGGDPYFTMGLAFERGVHRFLIGAGTGIAIRETPASGDSDYALIVSPELALPLRWRAHPRFTPSAILFARVDVSITGRDSFADRLLGGVSFAVW